MIRILFLILPLTFVQFGCTTLGYKVGSIDRSVIEIRQAITIAMGEPETVSENGRVFRSKYFPRRPDVRFDPNRSPERLRAEVTILGDRRPYDLSILVYSQTKVGNGYSEPRLDEVRSRDLGLSIQFRLNQSRDSKNFIDDFRPF